MTIIDKLPLEIVDIILEYNGSIKKRNGVYMNQIDKYDPRYSLLKKLPIDSINNMKIMGDLDTFKIYFYNDDEPLNKLKDIICNYDDLFKHILKGYDNKSSYGFSKWLIIDNVSDIWNRKYD